MHHRRQVELPLSARDYRASHWPLMDWSSWLWRLRRPLRLKA